MSYVSLLRSSHSPRSPLIVCSSLLICPCSTILAIRSPAKSLPMQAFMLYMSGSGIQIFSMGIVWMLLTSPWQAAWNVLTSAYLSLINPFLHSELTPSMQHSNHSSRPLLPTTQPPPMHHQNHSSVLSSSRSSPLSDVKYSFSRWECGNASRWGWYRAGRGIGCSLRQGRR